MMRRFALCLMALSAWAVSAGTNENALARMFVYRGTFTDLATGGPVAGGSYRMTFRFYGSDRENAVPLATYVEPSVPVNPDGSFEAIVGGEDLAICLATGMVTHVGLSVDDAPELKPRREIRPVVGVNRALIAEQGSPDMSIGVLAASQAAAGSLAANETEITGQIVAPNSAAVVIQPFSVHEGERTVIRRGNGVKVFDAQRMPLASRASPRQNQVLANAPCDGVALIASDDERMPGVVQFYGRGDEILCPISVGGEVRVTFWPFVRQGGEK